jgi:hypothetical protein
MFRDINIIEELLKWATETDKEVNYNNIDSIFNKLIEIADRYEDPLDDPYKLDEFQKIRAKLVKLSSNPSVINEDILKYFINTEEVDNFDRMDRFTWIRLLYRLADFKNINLNG